MQPLLKVNTEFQSVQMLLFQGTLNSLQRAEQAQLEHMLIHLKYSKAMPALQIIVPAYLKGPNGWTLCLDPKSVRSPILNPSVNPIVNLIPAVLPLIIACMHDFPGMAPVSPTYVVAVAKSSS